MRKAAFIPVTLVGLAIVVCHLRAQQVPGESKASRYGGILELGLESKPTANIEARVNVEARVAALAAEFGRSLDSALKDQVIGEHDADRMVKQLEVSLAVKRAKLDLLRVIGSLEKVSREAKDVPGSEEAQELHKQLQDLNTFGEANSAD
jgi:hypothetical protein